MNVRLRFLPVVAVALAVGLPIHAQAAISIGITIAPPALPVYVQPVIPAAGYIWTPGYWRWNPDVDDYYWVPGTWIAPPYSGALWTPGYWGWGGGNYLWHGGYWGTHVGFYGGVNYGFGYIGTGYQGGYWNGGVFNYNRSVNNVNTTIVRNVYNTTVVDNHTHVSYNGGQGGIEARPTAEEQAARTEQHAPPTALQRQHEQTAARAPEQRASFNHGAPAMVATAQPRAMAHTAPHGPGGQPRGYEGGMRPPGAEHPHPEHAGGGERHDMAGPRHENQR